MTMIYLRIDFFYCGDAVLSGCVRVIFGLQQKGNATVAGGERVNICSSTEKKVTYKHRK